MIYSPAPGIRAWQVSRRSFLRGLFAMPAVIAAERLMPVRVVPPLVLPPVPPPLASPELWGRGLDGLWHCLSRGKIANPVEPTQAGVALRFENIERSMTIDRWEVRKAGGGEWMVAGDARDLDTPNVSKGQSAHINIDVGMQWPPLNSRYVAVHCASLAEAIQSA
jgi:hypothetical protein